MHPITTQLRMHPESVLTHWPAAVTQSEKESLVALNNAWWASRNALTDITYDTFSSIGANVK